MPGNGFESLANSWVFSSRILDERSMAIRHAHARLEARGVEEEVAAGLDAVDPPVAEVQPGAEAVAALAREVARRSVVGVVVKVRRERANVAVRVGELGLVRAARVERVVALALDHAHEGAPLPAGKGQRVVAAQHVEAHLVGLALVENALDSRVAAHAASHSSSHRGRRGACSAPATVQARTRTAGMVDLVDPERSRTAAPPSTASRRTWTESPVSDPITRARLGAPGSRLIIGRRLRRSSRARGGRPEAVGSVDETASCPFARDSAPGLGRAASTAGDSSPRLSMGAPLRRRATITSARTAAAPTRPRAATCRTPASFTGQGGAPAAETSPAACRPPP